MNNQSSRYAGVLVAVLVSHVHVMAQTNQTDAARWLAAAEPVPLFTVPKTQAAWDLKRTQIRAELWQLLGKLPSR